VEKLKIFLVGLLLIATLMFFQLNSDFNSYSAERNHRHAVVMPEDAYIGYACKKVSVKNNDLVAILSLYNNMDESILAIVEPLNVSGIEIGNPFEIAPHSTGEIFAEVTLPPGTYYVGFLITATFQNGSAAIFTLCNSEITVETGTRITKTLLSGNTTVFTNTRERWTFVISVENPRENSTVKDTIPGEFSIVSYSASTGSVSISNTGKAKHVLWTLSETGNLTITVETSLNPAGKQEFTSPGDYYLNEGAELDNIKTSPIIVHAICGG
jgi:hypothetical protein